MSSDLLPATFPTFNPKMGRRTRELLLAAAVCGGAIWGLYKPVYRLVVLDPAMVAAVQRMDVLAVRRLALQGANVNVGSSPASSTGRPRSKLSALHLAVSAGDLETLRILIRRGADLEARNEEGRTPLMHAAVIGRVSVAEELIQSRAQLEATDLLGATSLILTVGQYTAETEDVCIAMLQTLLRHGADPHRAPDELTSLARAEEQGAARLAAVLRSTGCADLETCLDRIAAKGPLYAVRSERLGAVKRLVQRGVSFRVRDARGTTLTAAATEWRQSILPYLLKHARGIDRAFLNETGNGGTPLTLSAHYQHWTNVRLLLAAGADPNLRDAYGSTALHYATMWRHRPTVQLLQQAGAAANARDKDGRTALYLAKQARDKPMEVLLRAAGGTD